MWLRELYPFVRSNLNQSLNSRVYPLLESFKNEIVSLLTHGWLRKQIACWLVLFKKPQEPLVNIVNYFSSCNRIDYLKLVIVMHIGNDSVYQIGFILACIHRFSSHVAHVTLTRTHRQKKIILKEISFICAFFLLNNPISKISKKKNLKKIKKNFWLFLFCNLISLKFYTRYSRLNPKKIGFLVWVWVF